METCPYLNNNLVPRISNENQSYIASNEQHENK